MLSLFNSFIHSQLAEIYIFAGAPEIICLPNVLEEEAEIRIFRFLLELNSSFNLIKISLYEPEY